jgi:hypothetical protein
MMVLHEKALFQGEVLEIELHDDLAYRLRYGTLVEYSQGKRIVGKKAAPYAFKSVEQLRYDFERDIVALGGRLA